MKKRTSYQEKQGWRFRREITVGIVVHLIVLLSMVAAAWSNLQKDMAVIQHQLQWLLETNAKLQNHCENMSVICQKHEYQIRALEEVAKVENRQSR